MTRGRSAHPLTATRPRLAVAGSPAGVAGRPRAEAEAELFVPLPDGWPPGNDPSLAVVRKLGLVQAGDQWDEEDGLELVFELDRSA